MATFNSVRDNEPAEDTQNQVENEERPKNHQTDKINPGQLKPYSVIHLCTQKDIVLIYVTYTESETGDREGGIRC